MEFCSGSDLSVYIKNRGRLPTLDYLPRAGAGEGEKVFWPHPPTGGIDERVTRCFLGQLGEWRWIASLRGLCTSISALALRFLRSQDLIHRDIKPQVRLTTVDRADRVEPAHATCYCCRGGRWASARYPGSQSSGFRLRSDITCSCHGRDALRLSVSIASTRIA